MELLSTFLSAANIPVGYTIVFAALALLVTAILQWRKVNILERTSESSTHKDTMELLMQQISVLGEQLNSTREQLNELHDRNIDLMNQLREANSKIAELETILTSLGHTLSTK